ncbi:ankyrin repeat domain-containing protein [Winogradskyella sp. 3972H.M.0a.05]|uniref:ankyrin repeat domain-containing protein n=1 Tax=Winogradskyella sp. 3972H.M.0a.05 TaxID=2950277 RepID=UPI0033970B24
MKWFFRRKKKNKIELTDKEKNELDKDELLLSIAASMNAKNNSYESPLSSLPSFKPVPPVLYACLVGKMFMVKKAINNGSDINETDSDGKSPLHAAVEGGHLEIIKLLIELGAVNQADNEGVLPIDIAKSKGYQEIVDLLNA